MSTVRLALPARPRLGYYRDPATGDLWHRSAGGWSWVNGSRFRFVPVGLVWVAEPNPFA